MKLFDKRTAKPVAKQSKEAVQILSAAETAVVTGGLNPQPLPPGYVSVAVLPRY